MRLDASDVAGLEPVIRTVVRAVLQEVAQEQQLFGDRISYGEEEAAAKLGVESHVLRDARRRGEIKASRVGKRVLYSRDSLVKFLEQRLMH